MLKSIPTPLQTLYFNVLQQASAEPPASVYMRNVAGYDYWTAKTRLGATRIERQIGPVNDPSAQAEVARLQSHAEALKASRKLVSTLRNAGVSGPSAAMGRVLEVIANAGLFEAGALTVAGTLAYCCYSAPLGKYLPGDLMATEDIDLSVMQLAMSRIKTVDLLDVLRRADPTFQPIFNTGHAASAPSKFRAENLLIVETITNSRRSPNPVDIPQIKSSAIALPYQDYLVEEPIRVIALHGSGVPILAPQPARFAVHKLILATIRQEAFKRHKDISQARALFNATPIDQIEEAVEAAKARGKAWRAKLEKGLALADLAL